MSTPLISVIVPVYNVEKYLGKCLDALVKQTLKNIEIICVNDGSTDNSEIIVKEYAQKDNRIRYIYQENQGLSGARNTGIKQSKAPYLMFCDSDDWYEKAMCEKMYKAISENDVDFACCGIQMVYEVKNPTSKKADQEYYKVKYKGIVPVSGEMLSNLDGSSCNKIMKKELLDKYSIYYPEGLRYEDYCLFFRLLSISKQIYFLREYLYNYRRHDNSIMVSTFSGDPRAIDHIKIMEVIYQFLIKNNLFEKWKGYFYSEYLKYFSCAYRYLPQKDKMKSFNVAIPFMKKFGKDAIKILSDNEQYMWNCILHRTYPIGVNKIKIGKLTLIEFSEKNNTYKIHILGIQIFCRKIKQNKSVYSILHIPVLIRKHKNA